MAYNHKRVTKAEQMKRLLAQNSKQVVSRVIISGNDTVLTMLRKICSFHFVFPLIPVYLIGNTVAQGYSRKLMSKDDQTKLEKFLKKESIVHHESKGTTSQILSVMAITKDHYSINRWSSRSSKAVYNSNDIKQYIQYLADPKNYGKKLHTVISQQLLFSDRSQSSILAKKWFGEFANGHVPKDIEEEVISFMPVL